MPPLLPLRDQRLLLGWFAALALATLVPVDGPSPSSGLSASDALRNALLFAPIGCLLAGSGASVVLAGALALTSSLGIELVQMLLPGRDSSAWDVAANASGAIAGWLATRAFLRSANRPRLRLASALALYSGVLGSAAWLCLPDLPPTRYFGGFAPQLGHMARFGGTVLDARVGGVPVSRGGPVADSPRLRAAMAAGEPWRIRGLDGSAPSRLAPVVTVHDEEQQEIFLLGRRADDWVLRVRTRAARYRFDPPFALVSTDAPEATPFELVLRAVPGGFVLDRLGERPRPLTLGAARSWSLLFPFREVGLARSRALDLLWLLGLGFAVGLAAGPRASRTEMALAVALPLAILWGISAAAPSFALPDSVESLALGIGALAGTAVSRGVGAPNDEAGGTAAGEGVV